jgi:dTDP-4-amino-4,6-dideoxygalactose transaminase
MIRRALPPVGEPVILGTESDPPIFPGFCPIWTQSGTAALALAIQLAAAQRPKVRKPEVLIPAYGCPDLVAAAAFSGAKPVLVDIGKNDPGFHLGALEQAWTEATIAVVAVNFLGIRERVEPLASLAKARNAWLIEDSAQWFPENGARRLLLSPADAVILSFGRGKPVTLLGGGTVLLAEQHSEAHNTLALNRQEHDPRLSLKAKLYNTCIRPTWYPWVTRLPGLGIGLTRFRNLDRIRAMDGCRLRLLAHNVRDHLSRDRWRERAIADLVAPRSDLFLDLPQQHGERAGRLLRYPLLVQEPFMRDRILRHLGRLGMGTSAMYRQTLPAIDGVSEFIETRNEFKHAEAFADRLITLPVHGGVSTDDIVRLRRALALLA